MKITYLIHGLHNSGGMENVVLRKANWLAEHTAHEVSILVCRKKGRNAFFSVSPKISLYDLGIPTYSFPFAGKARRRLRRFLEEHRPDICISTGGRDLFCLADMTDGSRKICEFHFSRHSTYTKHQGKWFGRLRDFLFRRQFEKAVVRMDAFVVLTREDRQAWLPDFPNTLQIYNPSPDLPVEEGRQAALGAKRCIAVGRLENQKNYPDMIRAWAEVHRRHPDWTLDIFGRGSRAKALEKAICKAGLAGNVRLMGTTRKIVDELLAHSCLLLTSRFEGCPMVLLEAGACGVPAVSYRCPNGPAELIEEGESGFLVEPGDVQGFAERVCRVIEEEELRQRMGRRSREIAADFRIDAIMPQWLKLFRSLEQ